MLVGILYWAMECCANWLGDNSTCICMYVRHGRSCWYRQERKEVPQAIKEGAAQGTLGVSRKFRLCPDTLFPLLGS